MRTLVVALGSALVAAPALAANLAPGDAKAHVGQTVTVEGEVSNVHKIASGLIFIDMGGRFPDNVFTAVIMAADSGKFPDVEGLNGKSVDITGLIRLYKGKPEILLKDPAQLKAKE
jgi:DNA/RNA endonuclease YhcR with UshA esterase domain